MTASDAPSLRLPLILVGAAVVIAFLILAFGHADQGLATILPAVLLAAAAIIVARDRLRG